MRSNAAELYYTAATGLPELTRAVARYDGSRYGVEVPAERIVITSGSSRRVAARPRGAGRSRRRSAAVRSRLSGNRHFVRCSTGCRVSVPVGPDSNYQMTPELARAHWSERTVAALVATPSNPTGTVIPPDRSREMAALRCRTGGTLLVDEIYHGLVYDRRDAVGARSERRRLRHQQLLEVFRDDRLAAGMDGGARALRARRSKARAEPLPLAVGGRAARGARRASSPRRSRSSRRAAMSSACAATTSCRRCASLGFDVPQSSAGRVLHLRRLFAADGRQPRVRARLLEEAGVAITPGIDFGTHRASEHVRFAYTNRSRAWRKPSRASGDFFRNESSF